MRMHKPNRNVTHLHGLWQVVSVALGVVLCSTAIAAGEPRNVLLSARNGKLQIAVYKSGVIQLNQAAQQVSVGSSEIADILVVPNNQLYVVGKTIGTTNVVIWDKNGRIFQAFDVDVTHDLENLKLKLHELLPGEDIQVSSLQQKIVLGGQVSSPAKLHAALHMAMTYLPECQPTYGKRPRAEQQDEPAAVEPGRASPWKATIQQQACGPELIINMMQVAGVQQVMLEVKIAEIARDVLKRLDANTNLLQFGNNAQIGANQGGAAFPDALFDVLKPSGGTDAVTGLPLFDSVQRNVPVFGGAKDAIVGPDIMDFVRNVPTIDASGLVFSYLTGDFLFEAIMDLSRQKGLGQILAEPTLTTVTGQEAEFLSGGEFPIPVPGSATQGTTIEFKEFGVGVKFLPVVLDAGHISLKISAAVSEISADNPVLLDLVESANVFVIPSLTKRSATSSVELADGQTIGIAGLINENTREFVDKLPGLGDLPVFGALFRSQEYRQGQTELVMFVTPHLAKPIAPQQAQLPTDSFVPPDDVDFYLMGRMEKPRKSAAAPATGAPPRGAAPVLPEGGKFGHDF